jgi:O-antigen ligase
VVTALLLFMRKRTIGRGVLYAIVSVLVAIVLFSEFVPQESKERLSTIPGFSHDEEGAGAGSLQRREYTYGIAYDLWRKAPVFGIGFTNWEYKRFMIDPLRSAAVPHNSYLLAGTEGGVVTLALYMGLFIVTIRRLAQLERDPEVEARATADGTYWLISATRICLITFLVYSFFSDLWELIFFYFLFGLGGALIRTYGEAPQERLETLEAEEAYA